MPELKFSLDPDSVERAIQDLKSYSDGVKKKTVKIREKISSELKDLVEEGFNGAEHGDVYRKEENKIVYEGKEINDVKVDFIPDDGKKTGVYAEGKDAVFQEFGAGVYYNPGGVGSSPNPLGPKNAFYIGTYGKGYGARKLWGYYDESGELALTHGTPASKPMYHAIQSVRGDVVRISREVFKDGDNG